MLITDYKGKDLLNPQIADQIQKQSDLILKNKDVAAAYKSALHLKSEISKLNPEEIRQVFPKYRRITSCLKTLALPLLDIEDIEHLLKNNLDYLDTLSEQYLVQGIAAKIASGPDEEQDDLKKRFLSAIPKNSGLLKNITDALSYVIAPARRSGGSEATAERGNLTDATNTELRRTPPTTSASPQSMRCWRAGRRNDIEDPEFLMDLKDAGNKVKEMRSRTSSENSEEQIARQIYSQSGTKESEEAFVRRAQALVKSRLRDVRTKADLSEYLSMAFETGGLGLSEESLSGAQKIIEDGYARVHSVKQNFADISIKDNLKTAQNRAVPGQLSADLPIDSPDKLINSIANTQNLSPTTTESISYHTEEAQKELDQLMKAGAQEDIGIEEILKSPVKLESGRQVQMQRRPVSPGKVRLDDIKMSAPQPAKSQSQASPKSYGLSDEFSTFTLSDFRALGGSQGAQERILSKIKTLEQESIAHKIAGIRSFFSSPLYQQYVAIGEASLDQGKKLSEALADSAINSEKMTQEEFFAISDLNGRLK